MLAATALARGTTDDVPAPLTAAQIAQGRWSPLPAAPIPARTGAATVWTGTVMLAWGGAAGPRQEELRDDGVSFDPATDEWRTLPPAPLAARTRAAAV